jgi:hypothetical protein
MGEKIPQDLICPSAAKTFSKDRLSRLTMMEQGWN